MSKNQVYYTGIIIVCLIFSLGLGITGYYEFQKLKSSENTNTLDNYKAAPEKLLDPEPDQVQAYKAPNFRLVIPKIGLESKIRSDTVNAYDYVYHYDKSVMPGQPGECAFLGHRTTYSAPFRKIGSLKKGDEVIIKDLSIAKKYTYEVSSNGNDIRWDYETNPIQFAQDGEARLMLITCYPPGKKKAAWITHCKLVKSEDI
jgi:sortase A